MQKKMEMRLIREEIFKILFEYEQIPSNVKDRLEEFLEQNISNLSKAKLEFLQNYVEEYVKNEVNIVEKIKEKLQGWTFERLGVVEKVLLKMSFYEIEIKKEGFEIAINEAIELSKIYGDEKTSKFINGILAGLVKGN